jgi:hypothetical protein
MPHADEIRSPSDPLNSMRLVDRGGPRPLVVPSTLMQAAQLIEELRARIEKNEQTLLDLITRVGSIVDASSQQKRLGE